MRHVSRALALPTYAAKFIPGHHFLNSFIQLGTVDSGTTTNTVCSTNPSACAAEANTTV